MITRKLEIARGPNGVYFEHTDEAPKNVSFEWGGCPPYHTVLDMKQIYVLRDWLTLILQEQEIGP